MPYPHYFVRLKPDRQKKVMAELQRLAVNSKWKERKRLQAIYLSSTRLTFKQISRKFGVTYRTVQRWFALYRKKGLSAFMSPQDKDTKTR